MPVLNKYHSFLDENGLTLCEGALGFLRSQKGIDVIFTGVTSGKELDDNYTAFNTMATPSLDFSEFAVQSPDMIDPRYWNLF
jgi:aryl-alcohol dehydrogenase-like predicted oxidoreductase